MPTQPYPALEAVLQWRDARSPGTGLRCDGRAAGKDSHPAVASQRHTPAYARSVVEDGGKIGGFQLRIVGEDLILADTSRQPTQNLPDRNAQTADAGLARALPWLDGDAVFLHGSLTDRKSTRLNSSH